MEINEEEMQISREEIQRQREIAKSKIEAYADALEKAKMALEEGNECIKYIKKSQKKEVAATSLFLPVILVCTFLEDVYCHVPIEHFEKSLENYSKKEMDTAMLHLFNMMNDFMDAESKRNYAEKSYENAMSEEEKKMVNNLYNDVLEKEKHSRMINGIKDIEDYIMEFISICEVRINEITASMEMENVLMQS